MAMRAAPLVAGGLVGCLVSLVVLVSEGGAIADTFGGFSAVDRPYLVNSDRVCTPLKLAAGATAIAGAPSCVKAATEVVAYLDIKPAIAQAGTSATFAATSSGKLLTVTYRASGAVIATWSAPDSIGRVVDVFASPYADRVAITYTTRRAGKEFTDVVAFDLQLQRKPGIAPTTGPSVAPITPAAPGVPTPRAPVAPVDPAVTKALVVARAAKPAKALGAWRAVLAVDPENSEALYGIAAAQQRGKAPADAVATLKKLRGSSRPDAVEWLVEARFDRAFAALRADPSYRDIVGIGKAPANVYERLMGLGGTWEQTGTPCDKAEVHFAMLRDRSFKLRVKTVCEGSVFDTPFKGTWRIDGTAVVLALPTRGKAVSDEDEAACSLVAVGDEDSLQCSIGKDIDFTVLPVRR